MTVGYKARDEVTAEQMKLTGINVVSFKLPVESSFI